jgi:Protein of unknown function (DUF3300)
MLTKEFFGRGLAWAMILLLAMPPGVWTQQSGQAPVFKQEELEQIVAPIALYPDSLVAQILMASTFPLEVVQADRFAKQNASLKGEALTKALESQNWDPSVKSLVNFSQVLTMMSEKLDWTQKLGDAFLAQQKPVMDTIQSLRAKAQAAGNLKTTKEQIVIVEQKIIKIEPASPQVIYVPTYNPTVVYGAWPYPAYPPYYYHPPGYVATSMFAFGAGVAMGAAWGYAWGNTNWNGGSVNINNSQNVNINNNINRQNYNSQTVQQRYNQAAPSQQVQARQAYRGYTGSALTPAEQQQAQARAQTAQQQQTGQQAQQARQQQTTQQGQQQQRAEQAQQAQQARGGEQARTSEAPGDRGGASQFGGGGAERGGSGSRGGAFEGIDRGGSSARSTSQRGSASRGGGGGGGRSGGGGGRSGGGRR